MLMISYNNIPINMTVFSNIIITKLCGIYIIETLLPKKYLKNYVANQMN